MRLFFQFRFIPVPFRQLSLFSTFEGSFPVQCWWRYLQQVCSSVFRKCTNVFCKMQKSTIVFRCYVRKICIFALKTSAEFQCWRLSFRACEEFVEICRRWVVWVTFSTTSLFSVRAWRASEPRGSARFQQRLANGCFLQVLFIGVLFQLRMSVCVCLPVCLLDCSAVSTSKRTKAEVMKFSVRNLCRRNLRCHVSR